MYEKQFEGKVALVTGSGRGIGKACLMTFVNRGAKAVVADIDEENGNAVVEEIKEMGSEAIFVKVDVSDPETVEKMVEATVEAFGRLDCAVNNAGIGGAQALTGDYKTSDWKKVIDINLSGVFYCMRSEIKQMLEQGEGVIVNISSILGRRTFPQTSAYTASKHGVVGLTKTAALEYAKEGLRINSVGPAFINTKMVTQGFDEEALQSLIDLHPIGRLGEPQEVANLVTFLCSEQASFMTGGYYLVDGAYTVD